MIYRLYATTYAIDQDPDECVYSEIRTYPNKPVALQAFDDAIEAHGPSEPDGSPCTDAIIKRWTNQGALIEGYSFFSWSARCHGTLSLVELPGDLP